MHISVPDVGGVVNNDRFSWTLKMSVENANVFIKERKDNHGKINRRVYFLR